MERFDARIRRERLLFDGSMGALLGSMGYSVECPELLNVEHPEVIEAVHARYVQAGAQVTICNSLGATRLKLRRMGLSDRAAELTRAAVENARRGVDGQAYVALDVGSTGDFLAPLGTLTVDELIANYLEQARAGAEAGADLILMETQIDIGECRAACLAARETGLPVAASFTYNPNGRTLTGGTPECAALILAAVGAQAIGVNCSSGPAEMLPILEATRRISPLPMLVEPNAGLPETDAAGRAVYPYSAEDMFPYMRALVEAGASAIGGCCGTTPDYIARFAPLVKGLAAPAPIAPEAAYICSARKYVEIGEARETLAGIDDIEDLYDLDPDEVPLLDLSGLSPQEAAALAQEAQASTSAPLCFRADDGEALDAALRSYTGVAGVDAAGCEAVAARYGAISLDAE